MVIDVVVILTAAPGRQAILATSLFRVSHGCRDQTRRARLLPTDFRVIGTPYTPRLITLNVLQVRIIRFTLP